MKLDVGEVFSTTWAIIKERFWLLLGMWGVYFGLQIVFSIVFAIVLGGSVFAMGEAGAGLDSPDAALGGLGIGLILMMIVFYVAYILMLFAQQCSMTDLGSPLHRPTFGDALTNGFKSSLVFVLITLLMLVGYILFAIVAGTLSFALSFLGDAASTIIAVIFFPVLIWLALRFSVLVPVIAVEKVRNPITAITRTWAMTKGAALQILLVYICILALAFVLIGIPFLIFFGSVGAMVGSGDPAAAIGAAGSILFGFLLMIPLFIAYSIVAIIIIACVHAQLTDDPTLNLEETFG